MSQPSFDFPMTSLRSSYERSRALDPAAQIRELIDHLENPELLQAELLESARAVESCVDPDDLTPPPEAEASDAEEELLLEHFYPRREVTVVAPEPYVFSCHASNVDVLPSGRREGPREVADGLDYVGLIHGQERIGILGAVQSTLEPTPYILLLRALCGFSELLPSAQIERVDRQLFKGALGGEPILDLHVVLWEPGAEADDSSSEDPHPMLGQLTRDLADMIKTALLGQAEFPCDLGQISCLRMDPDAFDGRLRLDWQV